jgi:hypothetical protein
MSSDIIYKLSLQLKMKYLFIPLFFICNLAFSQKEILVGGKKIKMEFVDSNKFDIKGEWEIVDRKHFYDDGEISKQKWDSLDKGNTVYISDSIFYACSNYFGCNLIFSPIFQKSVSLNYAEGGEFFEQFIDTVLNFSVWTKVELIESKSIIDPVATFELSVLNKDNIIIAHNNSFTYLKRCEKNIFKKGWGTENNYEVFKYAKSPLWDIRIFINPKSIISENNYLEYIFIPNTKSIDAALKIGALSNEELIDTRRPKTILISNTNLQKKILRGFVPLKKIPSHVFSFFHGESYDKGNVGKFLWRIVSDTITLTKTIQIEKSLIFSSPNIPTKMYLVKFDEVEVIAEKDNWLHIKYYGKKIVEGWIRKADTAIN